MGVRGKIAALRRPAAIAAQAWPTFAPWLAAAAMMAVVLFAPTLFNDPDTYWHIATGQWILAHHGAPHTDMFSYTKAGAPWIDQEWLSDTLMALAYGAAGWSGIAVMFAVAAGLAAWLITRRVARSVAGVTLLVMALLAFGPMSPSLLARPHLLTLPLMAIWTIEMLRARDERRAPRPVFALVMLVWANMHGSSVFGFLIAGAFGLEALYEQKGERLKVIRGWGLFAVLSIAAVFATPYGLAGVLYPFKVLHLSFLNYIVEWQAADFSKPSVFEASLLATLFVCLYRGVRVPPVRLGLLVVLLYMALQHDRQQFVLAALAPLILAEPVADALGHARERAPPKPAVLAVLGVVMALMVGVRLSLPIVRKDGFNTPASAFAHLPAGLASQPVFNDYTYGGYLISKGVKVFIDGRSDMYGDDFTMDYFRATGGDTATLTKILEQSKVTWVIFRADSRIPAAMDGLPGWRRIYADKYAVVHQRIAPVNVAIKP